MVSLLVNDDYDDEGEDEDNDDEDEADKDGDYVQDEDDEYDDHDYHDDYQDDDDDEYVMTRSLPWSSLNCSELRQHYNRMVMSDYSLL